MYTNPLPVDQGKCAEAEPLHQRSLSIREKALGPEHLDVATSLNNLAELFKTQVKDSFVRSSDWNGLDDSVRGRVGSFCIVPAEDLSPTTVTKNFETGPVALLMFIEVSNSVKYVWPLFRVAFVGYMTSLI